MCGDTLVLDPAYELNFLGLICMLFKPECLYGRVLGILLALTCFVLPYVRLYLLVSCTFLPWQRTARGKCLEWLDFLGKWSLTGFYAFTIFMLFGNKNFDSQNSIWYTPNFYRFYVKSKPCNVCQNYIMKSIQVRLYGRDVKIWWNLFYTKQNSRQGKNCNEADLQ